jgi:GGDEF domain-containing protein
MTVSVGAAVYPADGRTYDELMKRADVAMYLAKGAGHDVSITALPDTPHLREPMPTPYAPKDVVPMPNRPFAIADELTHGQSVRFDGGAPPPWSAARRFFRSS